MERPGCSSSAPDQKCCQSHSQSDLHIIRLVICGMRAAARAASVGHTRGRSLEAAACRVIARQAQRDHDFVHGLWCNLRASSLRKMRAHLTRGDATATRERLSALDWAVVDLLLLYDTPLSVASFHQRLQLQALERTFQLVQRLQLEAESGQEVAPDRWSQAAREYSTDGVQLSAVALQRRWHELKMDVRRRACAPAAAGAPRPLLLPIHQAVATRYPHVVNSSELLTWRQLVAAGRAAEPTSERGPAPGEPLEPRPTDAASTTIYTIDLSDDDESEHSANNAQSSSTNVTLNTVPNNELTGYSNKSECKGVIENKGTTKVNDIDDIDIKVKPEIIEIDDDAPSPKENVEAMHEIDLSNVDATVVFKSDEEDVKTIFDIKDGNVNKDSENATVIKDNEVSIDSENSKLNCEIKNEIKVESNLNDDDNLTIVQTKDICLNNADDKIDIEEHNPVKKEESCEVEDNEIKRSSPNLNMQLEKIRDMIGVKNDNENETQSKIVHNSISCKNLEKLSSDQLIDEILSKCQVEKVVNEDNSILRLVLSKNKSPKIENIYHIDTKTENIEMPNVYKIEGSSKTGEAVETIFDVQSGSDYKATARLRNLNKASEIDRNTNDTPEYYIDANLIKSKIESHFNDNYIDPKLLMCPVILLRRIDEVFNIPLNKSSQPTCSQSNHKIKTEVHSDEEMSCEEIWETKFEPTTFPLNHKFETEVDDDEEMNCEEIWNTTRFEPVTLPPNHQKPSSPIRPSYSRMFYEKNKALLRKLKPCAVPLRRVDEEWARVGDERGRKVRLPDMEKLRRNHRGVLTAEVAPLAPLQNTSKKRLRPNTPENYQSTSLSPITSFGSASTPLQNTFRPLVPPPWRQRLKPPETFLPNDNGYPNPLITNPANLPNYFLTPPQFNLQSPNGSILQNALSSQRAPLQNPNVSLHNIPPNPMVNTPTALNYPYGLQQNNTNSNNWPETSETQNVFTHMPQRQIATSQNISIQNIVKQNMLPPNVLPQIGSPLTQIQEAAAAAATDNIIQNLLTRNMPTNQNVAAQNQNMETQNVFTNMPQEQITTSQNISLQNIVKQNMLPPNVLPQIGSPLTQIQEAAAAAATENIIQNLLTRNMPTNQNVGTQSVFTPPTAQIQDAATQNILFNTLSQNISQNMPAQNIANQNILQIPNIATQNISSQNLLPQNVPFQNWPLPGIQLPISQTGMSNINLPRLTIDGSLIAQGFRGILLKREEPLQPNLQTLQHGQIINPGLQTNPILVNPVSCFNTVPNPTLNPQPMVNNQVFLSNSLQPPAQMLQPPPLIDISTIRTPIEAFINTRPHPSPMEVSGNSSTVVDSETKAPRSSVTGYKIKLPAHLNTAIPLENYFQQIPKDYMFTEVSYKSSDMLDWKSEPLSSSTFVRDRKSRVGSVLCTGPGQGWRLQGHLLVSGQQRPPPVAAIWSLRPRVRLQLPTPDKAEAAPNLLCQDKVYQKLSDRPLKYAPVLVTVECAAAALGLLSRGAMLQLYCLKTCVLHAVEAQRLNDGSFLLSGAALAEAPLAELTRHLHPHAPRPPAHQPAAPILSALISAAPRPPGQPADTASPAPLLRALITAARRLPSLRPISPRPISPTEPGPSAPISPPPSPPRPPTSTSAPLPAARPLRPRANVPRPPGQRPNMPRPPGQRPNARKQAPKRNTTQPNRLRPGAPTVALSALLPPGGVKVNSRKDRCTGPHPDWQLSDPAFVAKFRLPKHRVRALADQLRPYIAMNRINKILTCLWYLGSSNARRQVAAPPGAAQVIDVLNYRCIFNKYVKFPHRPEGRKEISNRFKELYKLPNVVGVIDGVHIPLHDLPESQEDVYLNRAGFHSLNVQVICDADLNILNVDPSQGGYVHDCAIWASHYLNSQLERLHKTGEAVWLLGDSGYLQRETLMTPFPVPADSPEARYNTLHADAWDCVKRCIALLRTRWRRLNTKLPENNARKIINACAVLHNIAQECKSPTSEVDLSRQMKTDATLEEHQESAIVSLMTAPDRDRLLREWRTGVVARDALVQALDAEGRHVPNVFRRTGDKQGHSNDSSR